MLTMTQMRESGRIKGDCSICGMISRWVPHQIAAASRRPRSPGPQHQRTAAPVTARTRLSVSSFHDITGTSADR